MRRKFHQALRLRLLALEGRDVPSTGLVGPDTVAPAFDARGQALVGNKSRISDQLLRLYETAPALRQEAAPAMMFASDGAVLVRVTALDIEAVSSGLASVGFRVTGSRPNLHVIEGFVPLSSLPAVEPLAGLQGVMGISQGTYGGLVTSEADWVHQADRERATGKSDGGGFTGAGVKIGVLSNSFNQAQFAANPPATTAANDVASGDIPAGVEVQQEGNSGASDEGRAMIQLIYDVAPGASFRYATPFGEVDFADQIDEMANPSLGNCDVIVDDLFTLSDPFFQHGILSQQIDFNAASRNVAMFSSIGNSGLQGWESLAPQYTSDAFGANCIDFNPNGTADARMRVTIQNGSRFFINMQWDQPFYTLNGVFTDLDVFLVRVSDNTIVDSDIDNEILSQTPQADINFVNGTANTSLSTQFDLVVKRASGASPGRIKLMNYRTGGVTMEYFGNCSTANPHAAIASAGGTGAVPWFDHQQPEGFTSKGGNTTLFGYFGNKLATPITEPGPKFAAPDGTNNTFFGGDDGDQDSFSNFYGTSAAAPHAAAVAALLLQQNPGLTATELYDRMIQTADPSTNVPGPDDRTGAGLIDAYRAVVGTPTRALTTISDGFESGVLAQSWDVHTTGAGHIEVTTTNGPDAGNYHVTMDCDRPTFDSLNELTMHVDLAGAANAVLTFRQKDFNDGPHTMSATFVGSENSDGVAMSVDGTTWIRLVNLGNVWFQTTYKTFTTNLSEVAAANGLTLSSDTRIRFQQYDDEPIESNEGRAFDQIAVTYAGTLSGKSFTDTNVDGKYQNGEPLNSGRTVYIDTNANGRFDYAGGTIVTSGQVPAGITDSRRTLYPLVVNGAGAVSDVNVTLDLTHSYNGDLDIYLIHPDGTRVELSTDNGGTANNYTGTTFDQDATTLITAGAAPFTGRFRPEGNLNNLDGKAVFGTWYLEITDDSASDSGTLLGWSLDIQTSSTNFVNQPIPDNNTFQSSLQFVGSVGVLSDVEVTVNITHAFDGDLDLLLMGPNGKSVELSTDNGGSGDNYTGTIFDDEAVTAITAGAAPFTGRFRPEGKLSDFDGLSANGTWTLSANDDAPDDTGSLLNWSLGFTRTYSATGAVALPDVATLTRTVLVPDLGGPIVDLDVMLDIDHAFDGDLDIFLTGPGGQKVTLTTDNGGDGDGYQNTRFDDEAGIAIAAGAAPFAATYRPESVLATVDGLLTPGLWTLTVTDDAGGDSGNLNGWSMDFHNATKASSGNVPKPIFDQTTTTSLLGVSGIEGLINDLNVTLNITHGYDSDLDIHLVAPGGLRVELATDVGTTGDNFTNTLFDDEAANGIASGFAPFAGTFRPEGLLNQFDGLDPNGIWLLEIHDDNLLDEGTLNSWSITFSTGERFDVTDSAGTFSIPDLAPSVYTLREQLPPGLAWTAPTDGTYQKGITYSANVGGLDFGSIADSTAPTATITAVTPDPRNAPVNNMTITFSEPVTGFDLSELHLSRDGVAVSLAATTLTSVDQMVWTLGNLTGTTLPGGVYQLALVGLGSGITDAAKNAFVQTKTDTWTMDITAPQVVSITRADANPTAASSVTWNVIFSEPVVGLSTSNFSLFGIGAVNSMITSCVGGGTSYIVTSTTYGDGNLGLRMVNSTNVTDLVGNQVGNLTFSGESYTVNKPDIHIDQVSVNDGQVQRSRVDKLVVKFDQIVSFPNGPEQAFVLVRNNVGGGTTNVDYVPVIDNSTGRTVVTLRSFTGAVTQFGSLADGDYQLFVYPLAVYSPNGVLDGNNDGIGGDGYLTPAGPGVGSIHRLFGDADGDRDVDNTDFVQFRTAFGNGTSFFDFDGDGDTDNSDFVQFRNRFGMVI